MAENKSKLGSAMSYSEAMEKGQEVQNKQPDRRIRLDG